MSYREWTENVLKRWPQNRTSAFYKKRLYEVAQGTERICHLGCGYDKNHITRPLKDHAQIIGVDLDERAGPKYHSPFWLANAEQLPFADEQFDLVCAEYLLEHVEDPSAVLKEVHRVLAPGGRLVLVTPNLWSYKFIISAITPYSFHKWLGQYRYRRAVEEDMFPTLYRFNTLPQIKKIIKSSGFQGMELNFLSNGPTWFRGMPVLFELGCIYHKLIEATSLLRWLRCGIVVVTSKIGRKGLLPAEISVRCLRCGHDKMTRQASAWICTDCNNNYPIRKNMIYVATEPQQSFPEQPIPATQKTHAST